MASSSMYGVMLGKSQESQTKASIIKIGPRGAMIGKEWDDGHFDGVKEIFIWHEESISSIQIVYSHGQSTVLGNKHGGDGINFDSIKLNYPVEHLTGISGHYEVCHNSILGEQVTTHIKSLKFYSNKATFGPFGCEETKAEYPWKIIPFSFRVMDDKICGLFGEADGRYLHSIGIHFRAVPKAQVNYGVSSSSAFCSSSSFSFARLGG